MKKNSGNYIYVLLLLWVSALSITIVPGLFPTTMTKEEEKSLTTKKSSINEKRDTPKIKINGNKTSSISKSKEFKKTAIPSLDSAHKKSSIDHIKITPFTKMYIEAEQVYILEAAAINHHGKKVSFSPQWATNAGSIEKISSSKIKLIVYANLIPQTYWISCSDFRTKVNTGKYLYLKTSKIDLSSIDAKAKVKPDIKLESKLKTDVEVTNTETEVKSNPKIVVYPKKENNVEIKRKTRIKVYPQETHSKEQPDPRVKVYPRVSKEKQYSETNIKVYPKIPERHPGTSIKEYPKISNVETESNPRIKVYPKISKNVPLKTDKRPSILENEFRSGRSKTKANFNREKPLLTDFYLERLPARLQMGQRYQLRVHAYDQYGHPFKIDPEWTTDIGHIDRNGYLLVNNVHGQQIKVRDKRSNQIASSFVQIRSRLAVIDLHGTKRSLRPYQNFRYTAKCYDHRNREIRFPLKWSASGGHIDQNGYLTAGNTPGTYEVFVQGIGTNIRVGMYYEIARSVKSIEIVNVPAYVYAGQSHTFTAIGYDQAGRRMRFSPHWSARGGHITRNGVFTAGHQPGNYQVVVSDGYGVEYSITVIVKKEIREKHFQVHGRAILDRRGKKIVIIRNISVYIFRDGSFRINYRANVFQNKPWRYTLRVHLDNGRSFYLNLPTIQKNKGHHVFRQRGHDNRVRRNFIYIRHVTN